MTKLYTELAYLYDAIYQTFIDYDEEFVLYTNLLRPYKVQSVLEIGCGSGHLAKRFSQPTWDYVGVDFSEQMLKIARQRCPAAHVEWGDMRSLTINRTFDAVLITARTISYIIHNQEVLSTFRSISNCLEKGGKLIFDFIDASTFFKNLDESALIEHRAMYEQQQCIRQSRYAVNFSTGLTWDWHSAFFTESDDKQLHPIASDLATLRAFLIDEIRLFLHLSDFSVIQERRQPTYAFDTIVVVAEKL